MSKIKFTVEKDGSTVHMEVDGVKGEGCVDLTRAYEQAIGQSVSEGKTPEFYELEIETVSETEG